eukprot:TRINITY_DN14606_c0_g1_i1.p1 TRINITY_DN14606_c0_g1~~TRINITY_DN14606_c0_g1_i1.p1  ORF type:complete len:236 (+),score=113.06 TRINITY_DN14606_c0_g1_i1:88-795(+)
MDESDDEKLIEELVQKKRAIAKRIETLQRVARVQQDAMLARIEEEEEGMRELREKKDVELQSEALKQQQKWNELLGVLEAHEEEMRLDLWTEEVLEVVLVGLEFRMTQQSSLRQTSWERAARRELARSSGGASVSFAFRREEGQLCYHEECLRRAIAAQNDAAFEKHTAFSAEFITAAKARDAARAAEEDRQRAIDEENAKEMAALGEVEDAEAAFLRVQERLQKRTEAMNLGAA